MEDDADVPVITFFKEEYLDFQQNNDNLKIPVEEDGLQDGVLYLTFNEINEESQSVESVLLPQQSSYNESTELNSDDVKVVTFGNQHYFCIPINGGNNDDVLESNQESESLQDIEEISFINDPQNITIENEETLALHTASLNIQPIEMVMVDTLEDAEGQVVANTEFKCLYKGCEKRYATSNHLSIHLRQHVKGKTYACPFEGCGKKFATNYSLTAHGRTHTGEKPYVCLDCGKSFKTSGDLMKHKRTHTGEKPFKCPIEGCDKSFTTSNIRKVHVRSHTGERPYVCDYPNCGKAFAASTNYKNHARIHSGEKPYACNVEGCEKKFTEYSSLYKHQAVHQNSERSFECEYCKAKLKSEHTLNVHRKVKHGILVTMAGIQVLDLESIGLAVKKKGP
ncbi:zinc finger protein 143-like [Anthonomus grandis grandis]|uniref:zinc finger protein 143-like n=1 Tax=Anthonomus grandis grandis TaxID=2921223 RepID=UPI002166BAF8|nr:zinc finger protein 143-like [Anthonomus grandis grandis]